MPPNPVGSAVGDDDGQTLDAGSVGDDVDDGEEDGDDMVDGAPVAAGVVGGDEAGDDVGCRDVYGQWMGRGWQSDMEVSCYPVNSKY